MAAAPKMIATLVAMLLGQSRAAAIEFSPPAMIGRHIYWPDSFVGIGDRHALGRGDQFWSGTSDGGTQWTQLTEKFDALPKIRGYVRAQDGRSLHDLGSVEVVANKDASYSSFNSTNATIFSFDEAGIITAETRQKNLSFRGLPQPVTCGDTTHSFGCPFRTQGGGFVRLPNGTLVMSVIVYLGGVHANPDPALRPRATSIVTFRSYDDGWQWEYAGLLLDAASAAASEEGPNEHDLALLGDGETIVCVLRLDAGDGPKSRPFKSYARTVSTDGGFTWSPPESLGPGIGCARPRLLRLASGGLVLSGGRLNGSNHDNYVWFDAAEDGAHWEPHSISYWHNRLEPNTTLHFDAAINGSAVRNAWESTSYTSLIATGPRSGMLVYSRLTPSPSVAFAMPFRKLSPRANGKRNHHV